ncbi:Imm43 family immunity protein [Pseudomonas sp. NPDC089734]|uniref:Imm43 family immunity protein n=1 Tax=Pseudomonas sp. NPDC089734 TaxID=3364469 RepID=UPI0037FA0495
MTYYVMTDKKERGCPEGLLKAALYDKFYSDVKKIKHGYFPWYCESKNSGSRTPFPNGMVLIAKEKLLEFDIRSDAQFFYIASDEFLSLCERFGLGIVDQARIDVVSQTGKSISSKKYNVVLFEELDVIANTDKASSFSSESGLILSIKKLVLPAGWDRDIFKYKDLAGLSGSFICSQRFKDAAVGLKGIAYTPVEDMQWEDDYFSQFF